MPAMSAERLRQVQVMGRRLTDRPDWYGSEDAQFAGLLLLDCAREIDRLREIERQHDERGSDDAQA